MKVFVSSSIAAAALFASQTRAAFPADVAELLDTTADPCDDFYQYTCGNWLKKYTLPSDRQTYSYSFNSISDRNDVVIQDIIKQDWPLVGELWDSCVALDTLTAMGNKPLQPVLSKIASAPTKKDLMRVAADIGSIGPSILAGIGVGADARDATTNILYASNGVLALPAASYYLNNATYSGVEAEYRKYITTILTLAGVDTTGASTNGQQQQGGKSGDVAYAEKVVSALEKKVAAITPTTAENRDPIKSYNPLKYSEAVAKYPLTFGVQGDALRLLERSALTSSSKIVFNSLGYFDKAEQLIADTDIKDLRLYVAFLYVNYYASYLGEPFVQARFELYSKKLNGLTARSPRLRVCTSAETSLLPDLIGKYYFLKMFDVQRTENVQEMVDAIEGAMGQHIAKLDWLDDATRAQAKEKLQKVANLIGQSTAKKSYPFVLKRDDYFSNVVAINTDKFNLALKKIAKPVDRSEWSMSAATVNAYYTPSQNKMVFPAAILQPPFYSGGVHPVQNFGAVGAVIGHELTHGFDNNGRNYDGDGNQREWWTPETAKKFEEKAQCMKTQYSNFVAYGDSGAPVGNVNGNTTIGENIADNGGVSLAFDAYHDYLKSGAAFDAHGVTADEAEKLFFVSFGQVWCNKARDGYLQQLIASDAHAPSKFRVNGVAMNSDDFARVFQCKRGSPMNPEAKCKLW